MKTAQKPQKTIHLDNIATLGAPVWRGRVTTPLTPRAVRMQLIDQAADLPGDDCQRYVRRRLTMLDRALDDAQAAALDEWLVCEELLSGRAKIGNYGDASGGSSNRGSLIPDAMMPRVGRHAAMKRRLPTIHLEALYLLTVMSSAPYWDLAAAGVQLCGPQGSYYKARKRFIERVVAAALVLADAEKA
jgi:hypothetical protein